MNERKDLDELLDAVSRGVDVDWEESHRTADTSETRRRVQNLHVIAEVGRCAREGTPPRDAAEAAAMATRPESVAGSTWGHLTLLEPLGEGTFATVYRAWDDRLRRHVALKLLHGDGDAHVEEDALEEARILARVKHPGVVTVHGVERHDERAGIWMALVEGVDLRRYVQERGPLPVDDARRIALELSAALEAMHHAGVVHRDIKAQNVVRDAEGRVTLTDFGVGAVRTSRGGVTTSLRGTPLYVAPELLQGEVASPASDVYSLGVLLYFLVTGAHPVEGNTLSDVLDAHASSRTRDVRERAPDLPEDLAQIVRKATHPDRAQRFASAEELGAALRACGDERQALSDAARRRWRVPAIVAAAAAVTALALALLVPRLAAGAPEVRMMARQSGSSRALATGDEVSSSDLLQLEIQLPSEQHVYVLNVDSDGNAVVMFPIAGWSLSNPLPRGATRLPGTDTNTDLGWTLSADTGVESFFVVVSPDALGDFQNALDGVPAVTAGGGLSIRPADEAVLAALTRGVTGMAEVARTPVGAHAQLSALVEKLKASDRRADEVVVEEIRLLNRGRP